MILPEAFSLDSSISSRSNAGGPVDYAGQPGSFSPSIVANVICVLALDKVYIRNMFVTPIYILSCNFYLQFGYMCYISLLEKGLPVG
jgi:hypothetical protein